MQLGELDDQIRDDFMIMAAGMASDFNIDPRAVYHIMAEAANRGLASTVTLSHSLRRVNARQGPGASR